MQNVKPFALERYFGLHEFNAKYMLSCSDCEPLTMASLLSMASADLRSQWETLTLGYTEAEGTPLLRQEILKQYAGVEHALVAAPSECIMLFSLAVLKPGDKVVAVTPTYESLYGIAEAMGCDVHYWKLNESQDGEWALDIEDLKQLLPGTRLVIVNFPSNPTGYVPGEKLFREIASLIEKEGALMLCDEMYRLLELQPNTKLPAACELFPNAFSLSGMSKSYGLPGLRIGWVASQNSEVLQRMLSLKDYSTICCSTTSQLLAVIGLSNREKIVGPHIERIRSNLKALQSFTDNSRFLSLCPPVGGSVCFPSVTLGVSTQAFCDELVTLSSILLVPSEVFGSEQHVRFGLGRKGFPEVLEKFEAYLREKAII